MWITDNVKPHEACVLVLGLPSGCSDVLILEKKSFQTDIFTAR